MAYSTKVLDNWEENFIYISHLDEISTYWYLPWYPDDISDTMTSTFQSSNALGRSAPVMTYSNSGPRTVQIDIALHRDMMDDINTGRSNAKLGYGEDYVENLLHAIQAISVPKYNLSNKAVQPPLIAIRLGKQLFIKGVVDSSIGLTYSKPILENDKYAQVRFSLNVTEVDPYDASSVYTNGSFRGLSNTFIQDAPGIGRTTASNSKSNTTYTRTSTQY